jgi:hypothetical protein
MKHLKPYKIFESSEGLTPEEFCERYLINNTIKIVGGEIHVDLNVNLFNEGLSEIPKFGSVGGFFNVRKNNLKTFEFLPEECGGPYLIHMNPYEGELKRIVELTQNKNGDGTSNIYKDIFHDFIKRCLEYQVWNKGKSNEFGIKEAWHDVKLKHYKRNSDALFFGKYRLLDLDDEEILEDKFNLDMSRDWILEMVEKIFEEIKSEDDSTRKFYLLLLCSLIKSDEEMQSGRIKEIIFEEYNLPVIYDRLDSVFNMSETSLKSFVELIQKKLTRSNTEKIRDDNYDLFVFIGRDKFIKNEDDSYKKSLEIENFLKMDLYDQNDLLSINMMKMRARNQSGGSEVYMIWLPKRLFREEKSNYMEDEIPEDIIKMIDKNKKRIG